MSKYKITKNQKDELQKAILDYSDNKKNISGQNLENLFKKYNIKFSQNDIKDIIQSNDYNKNGKLEFNEFVHILLYKKKEDLTKEYRTIFRQFDKN